jgi:hypothetical protein
MEERTLWFVFCAIFFTLCFLRAAQAISEKKGTWEQLHLDGFHKPLLLSRNH